jgi:hypothetical protein
VLPGVTRRARRLGRGKEGYDEAGEINQAEAVAAVRLQLD